MEEQLTNLPTAGVPVWMVGLLLLVMYTGKYWLPHAKDLFDVVLKRDTEKKKDLGTRVEELTKKCERLEEENRNMAVQLGEMRGLFLMFQKEMVAAGVSEFVIKRFLGGLGDDNLRDIAG